MIKASVYNAVEQCFDLLFPPRCRGCAEPGVGMDLCAPCYRRLPRNAAACRRCAVPMHRAGLLCGRCQAEERAFDRIRAPWLYAPPLDRLIRGLKFHEDLPAGRLLGQLLARRMQPRAGAVDCLVPVPLHRSRLRDRGFNQAMELALVLSRRLGLPIAPDLLVRERSTAAQADLPLPVRQRNVRGAFLAKAAAAGLRVAVVDDVVTTAATAEAVAIALKRAGARRVEVWAPCRTPEPGHRSPGITGYLKAR